MHGDILILQWLQVYWPVLRHLMAVITSVCRLGIKLMEGEAITEGKKSYKVSEVGLIAILNYKDFNVQADTLKMSMH